VSDKYVHMDLNPGSRSPRGSVRPSGIVFHRFKSHPHRETAAHFAPRANAHIGFESDQSQPAQRSEQERLDVVQIPSQPLVRTNVTEQRCVSTDSDYCRL